MKFGRLIQVAIGLAATSGAFVLLSSNALADTSSLSTTTQPTKHESSAEAVSTHQYDHSSQTIASGSDDTTDSSPGGSTADLSGSVTGSDNGSGTPVAATSDNGTTTTDQTVTSADSKSSSDTSAGVSAEPPSSTGSTGGTAAVASNTPDGAGATAAPMASFVKVVPVQPVAIAPAPVVFRSVRLAIQPMIINHVALPADLADGLPSAPVAATKVPVPAKSNGGLDKLTLVMAGIIVPSPFFPANLPVDRIKLLLSLVTLVVLLANLIVMTYGLWLRRGGFATAARSDSPDLGFTTPIATPLLLGYVSAPPRRHSPSLVVSDYKTVKTLFSTLSERRIGI